MGHLQDMNDEQRSEFLSNKYEVTKASRRGNEFPYWNEKLHNDLIAKGYQIYEFETGMESESTRVLSLAKCVADKYRDDGYYARIICGYSQNRQRIKMYTIYYKKR